MHIDTSIEKVKRTITVERKFSILIPSWNNLPYLQLCIRSIRENSFFPHQIIVHINEGTDGTLNWIKSQPDIDFTYSAQNIGVCYALNIARDLIATDYILYMNDDMYACPGWDLELWKEMENIGHKNFFLSSTAIERVQSHNAVIVRDYGSDPSNFDEEKLLKEYKDLPFHDWQGSTWPPNIVHKDIWDLVGGYSIEFSPGMYSDPDFSMKLWTTGIRLFKGIGSSRVYHFGSKSIHRINKNKGYYTFIAKWDVTQNVFQKKYLHRGETFNGSLADVQSTKALKLKQFFKRVSLIFRKK